MNYLKRRKQLCDRLGLKEDEVCFVMADNAFLEDMKTKLKIVELEAELKKEQVKNIKFTLVK